MVLTIDIGHPPRQPDQVEQELYDTITKVRNTPALRIVKVVHGNKTATRTTVRNWAYRTRQSIRMTIRGENYDLFDVKTQEMRSECGQYSDPDLGRGNQGITIIWVK